MDNIYQYETNEDILFAKYIFHKEPVCIFRTNKEKKMIIFCIIDDR
jgi:hypothetical protein